MLDEWPSNQRRTGFKDFVQGKIWNVQNLKWLMVIDKRNELNNLYG